VFFNSASERLEIQRLKRALRLQFPPIVTHEHVPVDDKNIRLDTCEPEVERTEQRPLVPIVVVGMRIVEGFYGECRAGTYSRCGKHDCRYALPSDRLGPKR
jgi:hypothetical protein